jgi:DNA-binding XRE family transcriptional regulator
MIRNDAEHRKAIERIEAERERLDALRQNLEQQGLTADELKRAMDPMESFHLQLVGEVDAYERLQRGEFEDVINFHGVGRLLISLRIYRGLTQRQLAEQLGVHESQVSRDERNEYHGITVARATRILELLGVRVSSSVVAIDPPEKPMVGAV